MNMDFSNSKFIKDWIKDMTKTMKITNPDWDEDDIKEELLKMVDKKLISPNVTLDNNYTGQNRETTLLSVYDWVKDTQPVIAGNGTFYRNQHDAINPVATMLDGMLTERKRLKKLMFSKPEGSDEYNDLDRGQGNEKINCNSYYGASGTPVSPFYSKYSGPATTLTAQSVISTTETTFEAFLSDNFQFIDINECFHWLNIIINQDYELDEFINIIDLDTVFARVKSLFIDYNQKWDEVIYKYLAHLTPEERTRVFYKNQLHKFTDDHPEIKKIYERVFKQVENIPYITSEDEIPKDMRDRYPTVKKFNEGFINEQKFFNPNVVPDSIKDEIEQLTAYYMKYVYVPIMQMDRIYRLKNFKRKAVVIVDTDSKLAYWSR